MQKIITAAGSKSEAIAKDFLANVVQRVVVCGDRLELN